MLIKTAIKTKSTRKLTTEEFIMKAKEIHDNKYSYNLSNYINNKTKIKIICSIHGIFEQAPHSHLLGLGCKKCGIERRSKMATMSLKSFINKATKIHRNKYDYNLANYINNRTKIKIICPTHGTFEQTPSMHLSGQGCRKCSSQNIAKSKTKTQERFLEQARIVHGNKYDYSLSLYKKCNVKIKIICLKCGNKFMQKPNSHLRGQGCKKCGIENSKITQEEFINMSKKKHGNKYDYSQCIYHGSMKKVYIICKKHGLFSQTASHHLTGHGCNKCYIERETDTTNNFIRRCSLIHSKKYNYSLSIYKNQKTKLIIVCPKHGKFTQSPAHHINGTGCPKCSKKISKLEQVWLNLCNIPDNPINRQAWIPLSNKKFVQVDGYIPETKTVYEFYGDYWHGNPQVYKMKDYNKLNKKSFGQLYRLTIRREKLIKKAGYKLITIWESDFKKN